MKAIVYLRQSQDRTGEELGITRQREDAHKLAQLRGWTIVETLEENDVSASGKKARPKFEQALAMINTGEIDVIIAWDLTRLTRNARDRIRLIEACRDHNVTIALVRGTDIDPTTPAGRLVAGVLGEVAVHEIDQKSDRQKRAALQIAHAGLPGAGRRPFGYEPDRMTIREPEAVLIRRAYDAILAGVPLGRIARTWNEQGFYTPQLTRGDDPQPSRWTAQNLRLLVLNPRYGGYRARSIRPERGAPTWEIIREAAWEPIVSKETWHAAVAVLKDPSRLTPPRSEQSLLTGVATCGVCGGPMHGGRNNMRQRTYRCRNTAAHVVRKAEPCERYVTDLILARLSRDDAHDLLYKPQRPDTAPLRDEAMALQSRLDQLAVEFADGELTSTQLKIATERIRGRLADIDRTLADAGRVNILKPLLDADNIRDAWDEMGGDRCRGIMELLVDVVLLPPGKGVRDFREETVEVTWKV